MVNEVALESSLMANLIYFFSRLFLFILIAIPTIFLSFNINDNNKITSMQVTFLCKIFFAALDQGPVYLKAKLLHQVISNLKTSVVKLEITCSKKKLKAESQSHDLCRLVFNLTIDVSAFIFSGYSIFLHFPRIY